MLLNEIFDTQNKVTWATDGSNHEGSFEVDGEQYFIDAEEYTIQLASGIKSAMDIGFRKGKSSELTGDAKPGRVIGSVLAGLKEKVSELHPDIVMFGVLNKNGEVQKRKVLYQRIASLLSKTTNYHHLSKWYTFGSGEYAFMANFIPSEADEELIKKLATYTKL